ncbi:MAG: serine/threonine protein kinase [Archangiaceae bacterium]|nr:serine/threonine protein kinase [Archangiaceae bacterium]
MPETYGNYELLERLATGGMAEIFRARQLGMEGFEKELVIKRILPHLAREPQFIKMFLDEARIAARLNHPNISQIFNLGAQGGTYFIAMEYVDGFDLREIWRLCEARGEPMPVQHAVRIVAEAAAALQHAHLKVNKAGKPLGIVHRDVSPQNILVTRGGGIKVVDFGIAKAADSSVHTRAGVLKGKFAYMAPEQAAGGRIDRRIDIFALGVVLHELLTGRRLFKRDTDVSTLTAVGQCHVDPPSDSVEGADDALDAVVLKALAKRPSDRYQEAEELQLALEAWLSSKSVPHGAAALAGFINGLARDVERRAAEKRPQQSKKSLKPKTEKSKSQKVEKSEGSTKLMRSKEATDPLADDESESDREDEPIESGAEMPAPRLEEPQPKRRHETQALESPLQTRDKSERTKMAVALFAFLFGVTFVALVAVLAMQWRAATAVVRLTSQPTGANVYWNGEPLKDKTPCTLPAAGAGSYWLEVSLEGYEAYRAKIEVPAKGEREIAVVLQAVKN